MKDLLDALIAKNTSDSEESLRLIVSSLNGKVNRQPYLSDVYLHFLNIGLAGINILMKCWEQAIHYYREILHLESKFSQENSESKLSVDKLQLIHTLHNLAEVIEEHPPKSKTLRDEYLREHCSEMEQKYVEKFMSQVGHIFMFVLHLSTTDIWIRNIILSLACLLPCI